MLELNTKVRRNEERLAKENVPVISIDDQVCTFSGSSTNVFMRPGQPMHDHAVCSACPVVKECVLTMQKLLDQMGQEMQEMLRRSEVLGEQGDIDGSQAAATQAEAIKVSLATAS